MEKLMRLIADIVDRKKHGSTWLHPIPSSRVSNIRSIQNFSLIWLDNSIDETNNKDCMNTINKLRQVVNDVQTFTNVNECVTCIHNTVEKIFMITSGTLGQTIIPIVHDNKQLNTIYIFCENQTRHEQWTQTWSKVKGVFTDITPICEVLKQAAEVCDQNSVSISFVKMIDETSDRNELDQSFMYTQILKEILLTIDFGQEYFNDFLIYCREYFVNNSLELENVERIERDYRQYQPIWWYAYNSFLYSMLNRSLRLMDVDLILRLGFFIRDLHQHISTLHSDQYSGFHRSRTFTVYRGQGFSQTDWDQLKKSQGGLLSFNSFLSTSKNRHVSLAFARKTTETSHLMGVLFVMRINPLIASTPFAKVHDVSASRNEEEILFSMHSIFRLGQMKQIEKTNTQLWQVELTLTNDNDPQLYGLTERIREETFSGYGGWYRLGALLIKLGQFDKGEQVYDLLMKKVNKKDEEAHLYHMFGVIKNGQGKYQEAIDFYEKSIKINQKILSATDSTVAASYNNIGGVYMSINEYSKALAYYEQAFDVHRRTLPLNHPDLATSYNNIGRVHEGMEKYSKALSYYRKALEIYRESLPSNHPYLAACHNNIGSVHEHMGKYLKALSSHEEALEILRRILPPNHPDLACSYGQIGMVSSQLGDHFKAIQYCERALQISEHLLPLNHPDIELYKENLLFVEEKARTDSLSLCKIKIF